VLRIEEGEWRLNLGVDRKRINLIFAVIEARKGKKPGSGKPVSRKGRERKSVEFWATRIGSDAGPEIPGRRQT